MKEELYRATERSKIRAS